MTDHRLTRHTSPLAAALVVTSLIVGAALVLFSAEATASQTHPAEPSRFVVPNVDGVQMRCNPGAAWYPVANLPRRTVLAVVSEADGWLRVRYPSGTPAVVKADEVELRPASGSAVLIRRSRLRAFNPSDPVFEESFKAVFDDFLLPGVEMKHLGEVPSRTGGVSGILVEAPSGATGFVLARDVRDATPAEIEQASASPAPTRPLEPVTPIRQPPVAATPAPAPAETRTEAAQSEPERIEPEIIRQTLPPPEARVQTPAPAQRADDEAASTPAMPSIKELDAAFEALIRRPLTEGDPTELIEQYRQYARSLGDEGADPRVIDYVGARIQALELRARLRETQAAIDALEQSAEGAGTGYRATIERLAATRDYRFVGRLLPSTIYDGVRLPLLYRLVSIDTTLPRTLAYITPEGDLNLDAKLNAVVGVLSDPGFESTEMVSVIRPTAVDVLRAAPRAE